MANHRYPFAIACCGLLICAALAAQQGPAGQPAAQRTPPQPASPLNPDEAPAPPNTPSSTQAEDFDNPAAAYQAGRFDKALQGFVDAQVEHPEDPAVLMNLGSAHYKMRAYDEAQAAFAAATLAADPELAAQAFYNLGNVAFRQGQLEEAVARYRRALELNPEDADAKFNLEFTRDEIRRRLEEASKRQEEQQQQGGEQGQEGQEGQEGGDPQQGGDNSQQDSQSGDRSGQQQADQDQDGLPDQTERGGANPTDPANPDTDGDGLPDGQEDADQDGQVDEGETDPNNPDSDGDGLPDGQDPQPTDAAQSAEEASQDQGSEEEAAGQEGGAVEGQPQPGTMTPEEAARYLAALDEGRPDLKRRGDKKGRPTRPAKDW